MQTPPGVPSNEQLELLDALAQPAWCSDPQGAITFVNRGLARYCGRPKELLLGQALWVSVHPDDRERLLETWRRASQDARPYECELRLRGAEGAHRWFGVLANPVVHGGTVRYWVWTCHDIHALKEGQARLSDREVWQQQVLDQNLVGIVASDGEGLITYANAAFAKLVGYTPDELTGRVRWQELTPPEYAARDARATERLREWGFVAPYEKAYLNRAGQRVPVLIGLTSLPGPALRAVAFVLDLTARRWTEQALLESQAQLQALMDHMPAVVYLKDTEGRFQLVNEKFCELVGRALPDVIGRTPHDFFPPQVAEQHLQNDRRVLALGEPVAEEELGPGGAGTLTYWSVKFPVTDAQNKVRAVGGISFDISERKQRESALRESEQRIQALADAIPQLAWTADARGEIDWYNQRWYDYTGSTLEQVRGWGWVAVLHPDHAERVVKRIRHAWDTGEPWEDTFPLRGRDGQHRWFLSRALPIRDAQGRVVRWFGTNTDITERVEAKATLERQANLLDLAHDAIIVWTLGGGVQFWSRGAQAQYGFSADEALGERTHALLDTRAQGTTVEAIERHLIEHGAWEGLLCHTTRDGREIITESRMVLVPGEAGQRTVLETNRDVTNRQKAQQALRESEERLRLALQAGQLGDWEWNAQTGELHRSAQLQRLLGLGGERQALDATLQLLDEADREEVRRQFEALQRGERDGFRMELRLPRPDGTVIWLEQHAQAVRDADGSLARVIGVAADITLRKEAETALRQHNTLLERRVAERTRRWQDLNSDLRALVHTIANDLTEPLRRIAGFSSLIEKRLRSELSRPLDERTTYYFGLLKGEAGRLTGVAEELRGLARLEGRELQLGEVPLRQLVVQVRSDLEPLSRNRRVNWRVGELPAVRGDALLLRQVFSEFFSNALLATRDCAVTDIEVDFAYRAGELVVWVRDNRREFDPAQPEQLFQVTGDADGALFGVGLANVRRIMARHGGRVWAEGADPAGAAFYLAFGAAGKAP